MSLVPTGPLVDTRPPNFAKGQWFGGVPHTRVVIQSIGTWSALYRQLNDGILLEQTNSDFTDPNLGFAEWRGTYMINPIQGFTCVYRWSVASETVGTCNFTYSQRAFFSTPELFGAMQQTNPTLPATKVIPLSIRIPQSILTPVEVVKYDVPEWADVLDRWPDVVVTDSF